MKTSVAAATAMNKKPHRDSKKYQRVVREGRDDFHRRQACPYAREAGDSWMRTAWWDGWLQARTEQRLPSVFPKGETIWDD